MKPIKFIHTGDLHLGQRVHYTGEPSKEVQKILNIAVFESFKQICTTAQKEAVDFVLITGDVYDSTSRSVIANQFFIQQCKQLQKYHIAVYIIAGNHDPLMNGQEIFDLPNNVIIFNGDKPQTIQHQRNGQPVAMIVGQSYQRKWEAKKIHKDYQVTANALPTIAMLHTQLSLSDTRYVPASAKELAQQKAIDYWALGHVHRQRVIQATHPVIAYCGTPQGTDFGELGRGGALLVEMTSKTAIHIQSIEVATIRIVDAVVDVTNQSCKTISDIEEWLLKQTEEYVQNQQGERGLLMRWRMIGKSQLKKTIAERDEIEVATALLQTLNDETGRDESFFVWHDAMTFHLQQPIDYEQFKKENEIYENIETMTNELVNKGIDDGLIKIMGKIWSRHVKEEGLKGKQLTMDEALYEDILRDASQLILERLAEGRMTDES